jgi:hypothetical protein
MAVKNWSTTPASNALVDGINFAEGQNPSTVNDSARTLMADVAELYALNKGGVVTGTVGGTGDAITLATVPNPFSAAYATGQQFLMKATAANTIAAPTINVGALGAKTIKLPGGSALSTPQWAINDMLLFLYDGTDMILVSGNSVANAAFATTLTLTRNTQTGTTYTVLTGDRAKYVTHNNASATAVTLPQANGTTFGGGWYYWTENIGAGTVTITPTISTINLGSAIVLRQGEWALITSDNTNYRALTTGRTVGNQSVREVGTRGLPVNLQTGATYTLAFGDEGGIIAHSGATALTITIPANGSVAFPVGTAVTIVNEPGAANVTVSITTDTLNRGDGTAGTGNRTVPANSVVTLIKTAATTWIITGNFT